MERLSEDVELWQGDCTAILPELPSCEYDAIVTDPPYGLAFMGQEWDHGVPGRAVWEQVLRVTKAGGYMVAMGGTRTYHRLTCAIEDAGWEIRDCLMWLYGTGFPKGKGCLKPAWEPIVLARKPGPYVLPLGVDGCRVPAEERPNIVGKPKNGAFAGVFREGSSSDGTTRMGRYPANVLHDGSGEVMEVFAVFGESKIPVKLTCPKHRRHDPANWQRASGLAGLEELPCYGDSGTAARFFYCAKASKSERGADNTHPTVKPLALMRWLVKLVCPEGGSVLDPFAGSGSTGIACRLESRRGVLIEREPKYCDVIRERVTKPIGDKPIGTTGNIFATATM